MGLVFKRLPRRAGVWLTVSRTLYGSPFTQGLCFDANHVLATEERFKAWSRQGWPYEPKEA